MLTKILRMLNAKQPGAPRLTDRRRASALTACLAALAALVSGLAAAATASPIAARITEENFSTHHVGGPDADAGVGDWFLGNGVLCAAISDPAHESAVTPAGGVLVDLGHCGAQDDQWTVLQPMLNLSQSHVVPVEQIEAGNDPESAWIRTRAVFAGIEIVTTYRLHEARPRALDVSTRARRVAPGDRLFSIGQILLHPGSQTPLFSLLRSDLDRSSGFVYPSSDRHSVSSLLSALIASDLCILVGGQAMPPISYAVERLQSHITRGEDHQQLASFSVSGEHFTFVNSMTSPLWFGENDRAPGLLQLAQIPFMDIAGESLLESDYRIHVGDRADVASMTDLIWAAAPRVSGSIDDPEARIHIDRASGAPFTVLRPDDDGTFSVRLPPGAYRARAVANAERAAVLDFEISDDPESHSLAPIEVGASAWIRLPKNFIGRLTFLSEETGIAALFGSDLLGLRFGRNAIQGGQEAPFVNLAGSGGEPARVPIRPGRYRVIAVRGPEYEARELSLEARLGEESTLAIPPLARVAPTPGWIAVDFHVHSARSFDSNLPATEQAVAFAASGAEVLVATEHDRVFDPGPAIAAAGLANQLVGVTGVEVTSSYQGGDSPYATGHLNAFPMTPLPRQYRQGAPRLEGRRLRDALADIAALEPAPFVQMNHPRPNQEDAEGDLYFTHLGVVGEPYDPSKPLTAWPNRALIEQSPTHGGRDLDYHGVELMNGGSLLRYRRTRADWLSLLLQQERIVATANSDSHRLGESVGLPRTYVAHEPDRVAAFDVSRMMQALRGGRAWGTTGPLLRVRLDDTPLGGLHPSTTGTLHVAIEAAPWVPVHEWRAYVNGELVHRAPIVAGESAGLPLVFASDSFVTVEVEGEASGLYADAYPELVPFAFTNPIFVDVDGNGAFDAPGLPNDLPTTLRDPDRPD